jgi:hypothetical protein
MVLYYVLKTQTGKTKDFADILRFNNEYASRISYNYEERSDDFTKPIRKGF